MKVQTIFFDPMINYVDSHQSEFPYLCVSDSNTIGMNLNRFKAFTSKGSSFKSKKGTGGSYGIGKAAYYMESVIRTILVSSMYHDNNGAENVIFEGFAKLTTNIVDGEKHYDKGYYDIKEAENIQSKNEIPDLFQRHQRGTSIYIMGVEDGPNEKDKLFNSIIDSVVKNFWLAIQEEKLRVIVDFNEAGIIGEETITKKELPRLMSRFLEFDNKGEYSSPRPYFNAVTNAVAFDPGKENPDAVYFETKHDMYGKVRFYLIRNDQKHDRYLKMRGPRMVVSLEKVGGKRGFNGVLICEDKWNELLTYAEPPAHDSWERTRIIEKKNISEEDRNNAVDALVKIKEWVNDCIKQYFGENQDNDIEFYGIRDFLYTDKDLGSNSSQNGNSYSQLEGISSGEDGDFGIPTSTSLGVGGEVLPKVSPIASVTAIKKAKANFDVDGRLRSKKRKKHRKGPNPAPNPKPGTDFPVSVDDKGKLGKYRQIFDVSVRSFVPSGQVDKQLYTMIVSSKRNIDKAMIEITTGAAIGTIDVPIAYSDKGFIEQNRICDIQLAAGNNVLHFKFKDEMSHCITVATYEFK